MAIKDQCLNCKNKNSINICSAKGQNLIFDGISCEEYAKKGINLVKDEALNQVNPFAIENNSSSVNSAKGMFKNPFSFKGRIRRTEYCLTYLVYFIYYFPMVIIDENDLNEYFALLWFVLFVPMIWFIIAQGAKRCHDRDNSGWYQLIPYYGFWMMFAEGDTNTNRYGESPK